MLRRRPQELEESDVWQRDGGQCTFVSDSGRRCASRRFLCEPSDIRSRRRARGPSGARAFRAHRSKTVWGSRSPAEVRP